MGNYNLTTNNQRKLQRFPIMTFLSISYKKTLNMTVATALIIGGLATIVSPAKADNYAASNQQVNQVGVAVGQHNSVLNSTAQVNLQKQTGFLNGGNNTAVSNTLGSQTGVANGFGNNVSNGLLQTNIQQQTGAVGFGNNTGISQMGASQTGAGIGFGNNLLNQTNQINNQTQVDVFGL